MLSTPSKMKQYSSYPRQTTGVGNLLCAENLIVFKSTGHK